MSGWSQPDMSDKLRRKACTDAEKAAGLALDGLPDLRQTSIVSS
jgi:hypothetical protein